MPGMERFEQNKEQILGVLERLHAAGVRLGFGTDVERLPEIVHNLRHETFEIVVVGEFSTGKSTFLNALMGRQLLPVGARPLTATVNFLRLATEGDDRLGRAAVHYHTGKTVMITAEEIPGLVTTDNKQATEIRHVDLYYRSRFLDKGVVLVDSPGVESLEPHHKEITMREIERANACIFLFSAEQAGSKSEVAFLREVRRHISQVFFVMNKIDMIKPHQGETPESLAEQLRQSICQYAQLDQDQVRVFPVAAEQALYARSEASVDGNAYTAAEKQQMEDRSRMLAFEHRLLAFLTEGEKAAAILAAPLEKGEHMAARIAGAVQESLRVMAADHEQLTTMEAEAEQLEQQLGAAAEQLAETGEGVLLEARGLRQQAVHAFGGEMRTHLDTLCHRIEGLTTVTEFNARGEKLYDELRAIYQTVTAHCAIALENQLAELAHKHARGGTHQLYQMLAASLQAPGEAPPLAGGVERVTVDLSALLDVEQQLRLVEDELKELGRQIATVGDGTMEASLQVEQMKELKRQLHSLEDELEARARRLGPIPQAFREEHNERYRVEREGWFGGAADTLFGRKVEYRKAYVKDTSDLDAYTQKLGKVEALFEGRRQDIERRLQAAIAQSPELKEIHLQNQQKGLQHDRERKARALEQLQESYQQHKADETRAQLQVAKDALIAQLEADAARCQELFGRMLAGVEEQFVAALSGHMRARVEQQMSKQRARMAEIEAARALAQDDRTARIEGLRLALAEIGALQDQLHALANTLR